MELKLHKMDNNHNSVLVKNIFIVLFICLSNFTLAQSNRLGRIYFGTDVFMPANYQKNDLKIGIAYQYYNFNGHNNLKFAYSFSNSFFTKIDYKRKRYESDANDRTAFYNIDEFGFSIGYHKYFNQKKFNKRKNKETEYKRKWKNEKRKLAGRPINAYPSTIKESAFLFESALGYGYAYLKGNDNYFTDPRGPYNIIETLNVKVERLNLDICWYYLTRSIFEFSYNLRTSFVNFNNIKIKDLEPLDNPTHF